MHPRQKVNSMNEPVIARKGPYTADVQAGQTYYWCSCGRSARQPFCDGAHKGSGMAPLAFTAETTGSVYLCGCKATKKPPFCDGTHGHL